MTSSPVLLLLLGIACLAHASHVLPHTSYIAIDLNLALGERLSAEPMMRLLGNSTTECELCVDFMTPAVALLGAVIAGGGIISCPDLCTKGFNNSNTAKDICEALCYTVGLVAFEKLIVNGDPNPVWICEMLKVCPFNDNDTATISTLTAKPASPVQGHNVTFHVEWDLLVWTGVAEMNVNVSGPGGAGTFSQNFYDWQQGMRYQMDLGLQTKPSKSDPWTPGNYTFLFQICEASCTCTHTTGCKLVVQESISFEIKPNPRTTTSTSQTFASSASSAVYYSSGGGGSSGEILVLSRCYILIPLEISMDALELLTKNSACATLPLALVFVDENARLRASAEEQVAFLA